MTFSWAAATALLMLSPAATGAPSSKVPSASCAAIARESAAIDQQLESMSAALGASMAGHAAQAVAENKARNAVNSTAGFLNWAAPGAGTAIDLASQAVTNAATRAREARIEGERTTATATVEGAARRLAELEQRSQDLGCATHP